MGKTDSWDDDLDHACYLHDVCLNDPAYDQYDSAWYSDLSGNVNCNCDQTLSSAAYAVSCACPMLYSFSQSSDTVTAINT